MSRIRFAAFAVVVLLLFPPAAPAQTARLQAPETVTSKAIDGSAKGPLVEPGDAPEWVGEGDVIRVSTTLVTVPVRVIDRKGRHIPGLYQGDFRVYEDNVEQEVAYFAPVEEPATVALVLDTSGSTKLRLKEMQEAAIAFVDLIRPEDRVSVISFDEELRTLAEPTSDRRILREAILATRPGDSTRFYDAVDFVLRELLGRVRGRKAVVLFTDGMDTTSREATFSSNMRAVEESDAMIYTVDYGPSVPGGNTVFLSKTAKQTMSASKLLKKLAEQTGGRAYRGESLRALAKAFAQIAGELRGQYSLGYYPKNPGQPGQRCRIKVDVTMPEVVVRARDSYVHTR